MARQIGLIVIVGALVALLVAIVFPVFSQAKYSAKKSMSYAEKSFPQDNMASPGLDPDGAPMHYTARISSDRNVVRDARLVVEVSSLEKAEKIVKDSVAGAGGYIADEQGTDLAGEKPTMHLSLRIPEPAFDVTLTAFESLGHRTEKSISASDVTEQILEVDAQLHALNEQKASGKLGGVDQMIAAAQARKDELAIKAAMSNLDLTLQQKPNADYATAAHADWGSNTWNAAISSAMGAFRVVGAIAIWLLVYSPIWGAIAILVVWAFRVWKRGSQGAQMA